MGNAFKYLQASTGLDTEESYPYEGKISVYTLSYTSLAFTIPCFRAAPVAPALAPSGPR